MAMKKGDAVTNAKCPDWGTGVVLLVGENSVEVQFLVVGRKRLRNEVLVRSLDPVPTFAKKSKKADPQVPRPRKAR